ncbi:predicted protein [Aspergillus terreus NIH2624]|uniref:Uncharacterized protein n=1 Tax=Aspergillus terreus (strain NIH 2624 / FGSC A1156) TaxID=341663 RepID=Q0C827_ASPTN|nr:uncharacterized protein ATEG_10157 [Aspergillus terreus NIH2624]EAU29606.1 predicted protein [Aspergillus terreus NIH2624]
MSEGNTLFHHESWLEPWSSPDFPRNESCIERQRRFKNKPWWKNITEQSQMQELIVRYAFDARFWPWGFMIYRTTYSSKKDWPAALDKLNRYFDIFSPDNVDDASRIVKEGHRDIVIEDPALDGVSLESILASGDPELPSTIRPTGYVNVLDMSHNPEDSGYDEGPFYNGCMRLDLTGLFNLAYYCEAKPLCELYNYVDDPDLVPYTDGYGCYNAPKSILVHRRILKAGGYELEPW